MNLTLKTIQTTTQEKEKSYSKCPACGCKELIHLDVDWLCCACPQDTTFAYVQSGRMDTLFKASKDHGYHKLQPITKKEVAAGRPHQKNS